MASDFHQFLNLTMVDTLRFSVIMAVFAITLTCEAVDDANLFLYFPFDEGRGGKAFDLSPNAFVGTITKGKWVDGVKNTALELNNGFVAVDPIGINPDELTIELWFRPAEKIEAGPRIDLVYRLNGGGRPHLTFNRNGVVFGFHFAIEGGVEEQVNSTVQVWEPEWYHLACTQNSEKAMIYVNGELDAEADTGAPADVHYADNGISIGAEQGFQRFFNGAIDEVRIWSVALSAEEVQEVMAGTTAAVHPNGKLAAVWGKIKSVSP